MEEEKIEKTDETEQIRIQLKLSSLVKNKEYELSSTLKNTEIVVPSNIRRKGLSLLVNHLLSQEDEDDDEEKEKEEKTSFDFLLNNKLLRTSLEIATKRESIYNTYEECVLIEYFPSIQAPEEDYQSDVFPDWISDMKYKDGILFCGCYDGSIKVFHKGSAAWNSYNCHESGIKSVDCIPFKEGMIVASGGLDHALKTHVYKDGSMTMTDCVEYVNGHCNTIESVALYQQSDTIILASGDWDGGLCLWNVPTSNTDEEMEPTSKKSKPQTQSKSKTTKIQPTVSLQAHTTSISSIKFSNITPNQMITSSHDYSIKLWDIAQQDCLITLNGSRLISSFDTSTNSNVIVTTHPDSTVRLWDVKSSQENNIVNNTTSFKASHKGYVSDVQWSPSNPYIFATAGYDGTCKLWDIRSTVPLFTFGVVGGEKVLCLAFGECGDGHEVFCAGTDCVVKRFTF